MIQEDCGEQLPGDGDGHDRTGAQTGDNEDDRINEKGTQKAAGEFPPGDPGKGLEGTLTEDKSQKEEENCTDEEGDGGAFQQADFLGQPGVDGWLESDHDSGQEDEYQEE